MALRVAVPEEHVGVSSPLQFRPPVAVVGYVPWADVVSSLTNINLFRQTIIAAGNYLPIGHLEVGATLSVSPKDINFGVIEGETQQSSQSLFFSGLEVALECKINLFHHHSVGTLTTLPALGLGLVGNRGGKYDDSTPHPSMSGLVAYWTLMLGRNPINLRGLMPLFGIVHIEKDFYEYFIILNARLSSPGRAFPIGGSPTTLVVEVYSTGIGVITSSFPKIGDVIVDGTAPSAHILDKLDKVGIIAFAPHLVGVRIANTIVHPAIPEPTLKIHTNMGHAGQNLYAKRIPITALAVWGGAQGQGDQPGSLFTRYIQIVMA